MEVMPVNRLVISLPTRPVFGALLLAVLTATALPRPAWAQEPNAEAREQFGASIEEAGALAALSDAASLIQAGMKYLEAADLAANSGDPELAERAGNTREQAVKAYVDAGSAFAAADDNAAAAEAFNKAAAVASDLDNADLEAKARYNASVAYVSQQDFGNALSAIERAIFLAPADLNYRYVKGVALRSSGDLDGAVAAFASLDTLATEAGDQAMAAKARENIGKGYLVAANDAVKEKQYQPALDHLGKAAPYLGEDDKTLNTLYANAYYRLGVEQVQKEQFNAAEGNLSKAKQHGQKAGNDKLVAGAQQQLDYIKQVRANQQ